MCIKSDFKEKFFKLATNGQSGKAFLLTSNFCPQGVLCPCPEAIYMQKGSTWNWYKRMGIIKVLKCCQNLYQVVVCPCPGAIYMFEIVKSAKFLCLSRTSCQVSVTGPLVLWFGLSDTFTKLKNT